MAAPEQPTLADHVGPWTEEDFYALPEDSRARIELLDGQLLVSPGPALPHQRLVGDVYVALRGAAPQSLEVFPGLDVRLGRDRVLIPDVVVARAGLDGRNAAAADVVLVVEVQSPSTRSVDAVLKAHLYAEAGIPWYLRVSTAGVHAYALREGGYALVAEGPVVQLTEPFPVQLRVTGRGEGRGPARPRRSRSRPPPR